MRALSTSKVKILVVDDRASDRLAIESILSDPYYELVMAGSGREALRRVLEGEYAVILLDVMLPDMEGFEVAKIIKQRERSRDTPVIFLTAAGADVQWVYKGYSVGAVDYLVKPLDEDVLRAKVGIFVELYRKDQRIKEQAEALIEVDRRARARELAELKLASERRYRDLAEAILPVVWTAGADGEVSYFNGRWYDFTGQTPDTALGWGWMTAIHPDDSRSREESWRSALASGGIYEAECRIRGADGAYRWHICRAVPERDHDGELVGWLGTYTDCDDLKRSHAAAQAARRSSELIAGVSAVLSSTLDERELARRAAELTVRHFADACIIDLLAEDDLDAGATEPIIVTGESLSALGPRLEELRRKWGTAWFLDPGRAGRPELLRKVTDDALRALAHGSEHERSLRELGLTSALSVGLARREKPIGTMTFLSTTPGRHFAEPEVELGQELGHRAALAFDNARLYRGARRAVALRDEFLSIASHELRTPLTSLQLQLQTLERQVERGDVSKVSDKVERAIQQTRRLEKLIANLLDVSRILAGRLQLELEEFDLAETAREVAERFSDEAGHAGCTISLNVAASPVGRWDKIRIEQVLTNLVSNAVKYAPGAPIEVEVSVAVGGRARVRVRDHGDGIPPDQLERIFGRFERAAEGPHHGGLGLGLYIARHIVESHGGSISATSDPDGASFIVELPLLQA